MSFKARTSYKVLQTFLQMNFHDFELNFHRNTISKVSEYTRKVKLCQNFPDFLYKRIMTSYVFWYKIQVN